MQQLKAGKCIMVTVLLSDLDYRPVLGQHTFADVPELYLQPTDVSCCPALFLTWQKSELPEMRVAVSRNGEKVGGCCTSTTRRLLRGQYTL
jgi:hypothetical protein